MPGPADSASQRLLRTLGVAVRARRQRRGWTLKEASRAASLSARFLAEVEAGRGNISVGRLAELAQALGCAPGDLLAAQGPLRVALLGLRGAGKSTVGRLLGQRLGCAFVELDQRVEEAAGLPLAEVFAVHGEAYYRRLEREALNRLLAGDGAFVVAVGGGAVTDPGTYELLRGGCTTVWLKARPEEHMSRVAAQGDLRPMARRADALAELVDLLASRRSLYAQADHALDTSGTSPAAVAERIVGFVEPGGRGEVRSR